MSFKTRNISASIIYLAQLIAIFGVSMNFAWSSENSQISRLVIFPTECLQEHKNNEKTYMQMKMLIHDDPDGGAYSVEFVLDNALSKTVNIRVWPDILESLMITILYNGREISIPHKKMSTDNRITKPYNNISLASGKSKTWLFKIKNILNTEEQKDDILKRINVILVASFHFSYSIQDGSCSSHYVDASIDLTSQDIFLSPKLFQE